MLRLRLHTWLLILSSVAGGARAEVVLDGSFGPSGPVPGGEGATYLIREELGRRVHDNLFHSFERFGIGPGETATFTGSGTIQNVISRVTGGDPSLIAGTLRSTVGRADVFLLNPSGVVFAPGAQVDVPAALHVSTAHVLRFEDGSELSSEPIAGEVLSSAAPSSFGFLSAGAPIAVEPATSLLLPVAMRAIDLVGGDIEVRGAILSLGQDVRLVATGGVADVPVQSAPGEVPEPQGGKILVTDGGAVRTVFPASPRVELSAGEIEIQGAGSTVTVQGAIPSREEDTTTAGIQVAARTLRVSEGGSLRADASGGPGTIGLPVTVRARRVEVRDGGRIDTETGGMSGATAGTLQIAASESMQVTERSRDGVESIVSARSTSSGDAGTVVISTPHLLVSRDGRILARAEQGGDAGTILLDVGRLEVLADEPSKMDPPVDGTGVATPRSGRGPNGRPAHIDAGARAPATGAAGRLELRASESVRLGGEFVDHDPEDRPPRAGLFVEAGETGGGTLLVETPLLELRRHGTIDGSSLPGRAGDASQVTLRIAHLDASEESRIRAQSEGSGATGRIEVDASQEVTLDHAVMEADSFGSGPGGLVRVAAPVLRVTNDGEISADAQQVRIDVAGGGSPGEILLEVGRLELGPGGKVIADVRNLGSGARIGVRASEAVVLESTGGNPEERARISTLAEGDGNAGSVEIDTPYLRVGEFSRIEASTTGDSGSPDGVARSGDAGSVRIRADDVVVEPRAKIASSARGPGYHSGDGGNVELDVKRLRMDGNGQLTVETQTRGNGGSLVVRASEWVHASMETEGGAFFAIASTANRDSSGNAGDVRVEAPLVVLEGASIGATSQGAGRAGSVHVIADRIALRDGATVASDAEGVGMAGAVAVTARDALVVEGIREDRPSGVFSRTRGAAPGAQVEVDAGRIALRDGGEIAASSTGTGDAGDVTIRVRDDLLLERGAIRTSAPAANGGDIVVRVGNRLDLVSGRIAADVGDGRGGNVLLEPRILLMRGGSAVTAQAGAGQGGVIRIVADVVVRAQDSVVSASAGAAGIDGTVRIETPGFDYTASLQALPAEFVDAVALLHERCAARRGADASFVVATGAAAATPSGLVPVAWDQAGAGVAEGRSSVVMEPLGEGWRVRCDG